MTTAYILYSAHPGLPQWPALTADMCPTMIFATPCVIKNNPDTAERKASGLA